MKRNHFGKNIVCKSVAVGFALVCFAATSYGEAKKSDKAAAQSTEAGSTITISRTPSVGSGVDVDVLIDGKRVKTLLKGSRYQGTLSPGKHVISVMPRPNTTGQRENKVEMTAEKGHAYVFTIGHAKSGELVLTKKS
ncbi:MAG TPA: hypothetical protein VJ719_10835 [Chthoniobacterales bacterium]|nr:hypothetical protein [Chthoniobacterales bacterium]